jgi:hypothetical protein
MNLKFYGRILFFIFAINLFFAQGIFATKEMVFSSIRHKAMGGAGVAISFDEHALYKNPACLSRCGLDFKLPRFRFEATDDIFNSQDKFETLMNSQSMLDQFNAARALIGSEFGINLGISPLLSFTMENFAVGAFANGHLLGSIKNQTDPRVELEGYVDSTAQVGFSRKVTFADKTFALGWSGGMVGRTTIYDETTGKDIYSINLLDSIIKGAEISPQSKYAVGWTFNMGMLTSVDTMIGSGHFGLVINNMLSELTETRTAYEEGIILEDIRLPMTMTMGLGIETSIPKSVPFFSDFIGDFTAAIDYKIISPDSSMFKNLYMGVEKKILGDRIILRGGINQGYIVGGFGVDLYILHLNYAYYSEEAGSDIGIRPIKCHVFEIGVLL